MQRLNNEQYLDTEDFWKYDFKVEFIQHNKNGTEKWKVTNLDNEYFTHCTSMLAAFKIAHTAMERKEGYQLSIDHSNILRKAGEILGYSIINYSYMMKYCQFFNNVWHDDRKYDKREIYQPKEA